VTAIGEVIGRVGRPPPQHIRSIGNRREVGATPPIPFLHLEGRPRISEVDIEIRPIQDGDWLAIVALDSSVYGADGLSEAPDVLGSRGRASPATSFVLEAGARLAGYVLALPYPEGQYPDLGRAKIGGFRSTNLHLHDLVIDREFRGAGLAGRLLRRLAGAARSAWYERISLIAVGGSAGFWRAKGYAAHPDVAVPPCYGADPVYMSKPVTSVLRPMPVASG
jgi:GNAT superfamily N-acetyltransferase